jgi:hypothetical protein
VCPFDVFKTTPCVQAAPVFSSAYRELQQASNVQATAKLMISNLNTEAPAVNTGDIEELFGDPEFGTLKSAQVAYVGESFLSLNLRADSPKMFV